MFKNIRLGLVLAIVSFASTANAGRIPFSGVLNLKTFGAPNTGIFGGGAATTAITLVTIDGELSVSLGPGPFSAIATSSSFNNNAGANLSVVGGFVTLFEDGMMDRARFSVLIDGDSTGQLIFEVRADAITDTMFSQENLNAFSLTPTTLVAFTDFMGVATYSGSFQTLPIESSTVPEPTSFIILGALFAPVGLIRRCKA